MSLPHYEPFYLPTLDALRTEIARLGLDLPLDEDLSLLGAPLPGLPLAIPNRFCAQPVTGLDAAPDGSPGPLTRRRYLRTARGGFGLVWVESTAAGPSAPPGVLRLDKETRPAFADLVTRMREAARTEWGRHVTIILQLAPSLPGPLRVHRTPGDDENAPLASDQQITQCAAQLVQAAALAAEAGFDGVDVQASRHALPGAVLGAFTREGPYGGTFENRSRLLLDVLSGIRSAAPGLHLAVRLSACHAVRMPFGFGVHASDYRRPDWTEPARLARLLRKAGVTLLNVTTAGPNLRGPAGRRAFLPFSDHHPADEHPLTALARRLDAARSLRAAAPGLAVVASGFAWLRHHLPQAAAGGLASNTMDIVGMGRGALACPDAPARILARGRLDQQSACMACFACDAMLAAGGPVGCLIRDPESYAAPWQSRQRLDPARLKAEARRCHLCEAAPCVPASRTGADIPAFIKAFRDGDPLRACEIIRKSDVLPEMTSRLSPGSRHAEGACVENALSGAPIPIRDLQYAVARRARRDGATALRLPPRPAATRIAVVGAGPAGLAAAIRLLEHGHRVDLHERSDTLGGTPELLIPASRYPSAKPEIDALLRPALEAGRLLLHHRHTLGENLDLDTLCASSDAVLLAPGLWHERSLGRAPGVVDALSFLESAKRRTLSSVPPRVAVLAGGDCAMDAARTAESLGASEIFIVFGGPRSAMHWHLAEEWFAQPGHHALMHCQPLGYDPDQNRNLPRLRLRHLLLHTESTLPAGLVVEAMGLEPPPSLKHALRPLAFNHHGLLATVHGSRTTRPRVHAAGALVNGGASVARCVADGLAAAEDIHQSLSSSPSPASVRPSAPNSGQQENSSP